MNLNTVGEPKSPLILVVQNIPAKLAADSLVVASFNKVYISLSDFAIPEQLSQSKNSAILLWIQQNQPDLIIFDLQWSEIKEWQLITALRLDWLTRDIPIIVIKDCWSHHSNNPNHPDFLSNLDYDACLSKPYSVMELERLICSLIFSPVCSSCVR